MESSLYSAMFGAMTQEHRLNIIANNLANVNTTGFKQDRYAFEDTMINYAHDLIRQPVLSLRDKQLFPDAVNIARPRLAESQVDFSQGSLKNTENPLDLAIMGDGFFKVRTEVGDFYTRNGNFQLSPEGKLVTSEGFPVLGGGGELVIPQSSNITIGPDGQIFADDEAVGQIDVVTVDNLKALEKYGANFFTLPEGSDAAEVAADDFEVAQGYLETPNVNVVQEMVNMIEAHRAFEAYQKVITTSNETDTKLMTKVGKTA